MKPRILLIHPPIYDFSAYDFWLKPYGMLRVAGFLRGQAEFALFDYLDRVDPRVPQGHYRCDPWGRGEFYSEIIEKPATFSGIRRRFKRFGLPRDTFKEFLSDETPFDYAFVQTGMTYWYLGVKKSSPICANNRHVPKSFLAACTPRCARRTRERSAPISLSRDWI